ncbi:MAG: galactose mutarotase [Rikenellaceae bacterium]|jgi:aldose 1-epimerase|nr:galactose mutarotase [Rikenellaceae bacterium]
MKKTLLLLAAAAVCFACNDKKGSLALMKAENFADTVDGKPVGLYTLSAGDLVLQATNYGGRVVSLWTPDRNGNYEDIVLGYENLDRYVNNNGERFLGAPVGRYANRIAGGCFTLDGVEYTLPQNNNGQTLHGGLTGIDRVVWDVRSATESRLELTCTVKDGDDGFPGNLTIDMTYELTPQNEFRVSYKATTDAPTVVNLSHHSFFNLKGEGNGTVLDNVLTINGSHTTPVDSVLIPTGEIVSVEGTPFDFREPHVIGERIDADNEQLRMGKGYDHNWVLDGKGGVELAATLWEPAGGRYMEVLTDQPGLQFYSGNFFTGSNTGKTGKALNFRGSLALETQKFPDSPNHPYFPSTVLRPGETYTQSCIYRFGVK